jgi:Tol biopolymer transport system component
VPTVILGRGPDRVIEDEWTRIEIWRASVDADGHEVSGASADPHLSADGRLLVFVTDSSDLTDPGPSGSGETVGPLVVVKDLQTGAVERIAIGLAPRLSPDASIVVYSKPLGPTDAPLTSASRRVSGVKLERFERGSGRTQSIAEDPAAAWVHESSLSFDGRFVGYTSAARAWLHDARSGTSEALGEEAASNPSLSNDGRWVAYHAGGLELLDRSTGVTRALLPDGMTNGSSTDALSGDGAAIILTTSTDDSDYLWIQEVATSKMLVAESVDSLGEVVLSRDADVAVLSTSDPYVPIAFDHQGGYHTDQDRSFDIFALDRGSRKFHLLTQPSEENEPGDSRNPACSADGHLVAFDSDLSTLVPDDGNGERDVFVVRFTPL